MANHPPELTQSEQAELTRQRELDEEQQQANFTVGGGGAISDMGTQQYGHTYSPAPPNTNIAYSGSDTKAYVVTYGQVAKDSFIPIKNLSAISYSVHRDKSPVRRLGDFIAEDYTKGTRTVAGSIVVINFDRAAFYELVAGVDIYGEAGAEIELADNIPPFDILLVFSEENKGRRTSRWADGQIGPPKPEDAADYSYMWIRDVHFVDEGSVTGTEEMYMETTLQYVARHVEYMKPNNVFLESSDVTAIQADLDAVAATAEITRAEPYRIFTEQTDEIAQYSSYTEHMWLDGTKGVQPQSFELTAEFTVQDIDSAISGGTCSDGVQTYANEGECLAADPGVNTWTNTFSPLPAKREAGTQGETSVWKRQFTRLDLNNPEPPVHMISMTDIDFTVMGKVQGGREDFTEIVYESYTIDAAARRLTIENSHFLTPSPSDTAKWWRKPKDVTGLPRFGNKFQNDLHSIGKPLLEEITETFIYDATNTEHTPGEVIFAVGNPDLVTDASITTEFENSLDDHSISKSSVGEHLCEISSPTEVAITVEENDVQQTENFTHTVNFEDYFEEFQITDSYENATYAYINVEFNYDFFNQHNAPMPFLNHTGTLPHNLVVDRDGSGEDPFVIDTQLYDATGISMLVTVPPQEPELQTQNATRSGPGITSVSHSYPITLDGALTQTILQGPVDEPLIAENDYQLQVPHSKSKSGYLDNMHVEEVVNLDENGGVMDNWGDSGIPTQVQFTIEGHNEHVDGITHTATVQKSSDIETVTQDIGTYTYTANSNVQSFPWVGDANGNPANENIHEVVDVIWDNTNTTNLLLPPLTDVDIDYSEHTTLNFTANGARVPKLFIKQTNFTDWHHQGDQGIVSLIPGFGPGWYDKYSLWDGAQGGGAFTAACQLEGSNYLQTGWVTVDLMLEGDDLVAKLGDATRHESNFNEGLSYINHHAYLDQWMAAEEIQTATFWLDWIYTDNIPIGVTYKRTTATPLTYEVDLISDTEALEVNFTTIVVQTEDGLYYNNFDSNIEVVNGQWHATIGNLQSHLDATITIEWSFLPIGTLDANLTWTTWQNQAFEDTVVINLGPDEIRDWNTTSTVKLICQDSMDPNLGNIEASAFGITIGQPVAVCSDGTSPNRIDCEAASQTWSQTLTISDMPGFIVTDTNQVGWFGNWWNGLTGDARQPKGNIGITVEYYTIPVASASLPITFTYKYMKDPQLDTPLTHLQCLGIDNLGEYSFSKIYEADTNWLGQEGDVEPIKIINPLQVPFPTPGTCSDPQWLSEPACNNAGTCSDPSFNNDITNCVTPLSWTSAANTWTVTSAPGYIPISPSLPGGMAVAVLETTDYNNTTNPPSLNFMALGLEGKETQAGETSVTFTITYDVQRGILPLNTTYIREMASEVYSPVDTKIDYTFSADIPLLTAPATLANGDQKIEAGAGAGPLSGQMDIVEKVTWLPEDLTSPGEFDLSPIELAQVPADADVFNITDVKNAYYIERDGTETNPTSPAGGYKIIFPTGLDPVDDQLQTVLTQVGADYGGAGDREYRIEVDYKTLDAYIPPSKYVTPGYLLTAILNISTQVDSAGNALEVVLDTENNSINYYRGFGTCVGYMQPIGLCNTAGGSGSYTDATSCISHGTCAVDDGSNIVVTADTDENACNAMADPAGSCSDGASGTEELCCTANGGVWTTSCAGGTATWTDPITANFIPYIWDPSATSTNTTMAECVAAGETWHFDDTEDIALCTQLGGTYTYSPGLQDPSKEFADGICALGSATVDTLIDSQRFVQFSFMFAGPAAIALPSGGTGLELWINQGEKFRTLDEAVAEMKKKWKLRFGT